jgi:hypothetical protein
MEGQEAAADEHAIYIEVHWESDVRPALVAGAV